jgi:hypothetical protein
VNDYFQYDYVNVNDYFQYDYVHVNDYFPKGCSWDSTASTRHFNNFVQLYRTRSLHD